MPSAACTIAIAATAFTRVGGFSTCTTVRCGIRSSIANNNANPTHVVLATTEETEDGTAGTEESARRKMLGARLQIQKNEAPISVPTANGESKKEDTKEVVVEEDMDDNGDEEATIDDVVDEVSGEKPEIAEETVTVTATKEGDEVVADVGGGDEEAASDKVVEVSEETTESAEETEAVSAAEEDKKVDAGEDAADEVLDVGDEDDNDDVETVAEAIEVEVETVVSEEETPVASSAAPAPAVAETVAYFAEKQGPATPRSPAPAKPAVDNGLKLEIVANIAGDITRDLLSILRFGAANLLTSSLPENQRQDLLQRMGARMIAPASSSVEDTEVAVAKAVAKKVVDLKEEQRASVQEEIAVARAEETQKNEKKWEREKEEILSQMEEAANERVKNELKIQQMRLEEEKEQALREKLKEMEDEKKRLALALEEATKDLEASIAATEEKVQEKSDTDNVEVSELFVGVTDEQEEQNRELEALLEKRKKQQEALESIEEELRVSVEKEAKDRELLESMLEKRKGQQTELNAVEENLRTQVAEIEKEKAQYRQLVEDLEAIKQKEVALKLEVQKEQEFLSEAEKAASSTSQSDDDTDEDSESEEGDEVELENPVLGPVVADLGYKRIHFVSSGKLGTIPVWNRNRIYRNNRAKSMATEKIKSMELGFPGVICLHEGPNGKLSIVDGQHRVGMMAALRESMNKKIEAGQDPGVDTERIFEKVLVEVYPEPAQESEEESGSDAFAEKVFLEINKAEPVKLIDMPGVASAADRQIITEAVETLNEQYAPMFSPSQRCRVPNVNVDNLRSVVFGANILKRHKLTTSKKLIDWLFEQNAALGDEYENNEEKQKLVSKKQWSKASDNNFYLGLESSWLYK